jgi:hypothetical protein
MDIVLQSNVFTPKDIKQINYCRLYLQVVTMATGTELDYAMRTGHRSILSSQTKWHHVHQKRLSAKAWKLWKKVNRLWSNDQDQLFEPLRHWLYEPRMQRRKWHAYYQDSTYTLYTLSQFHTPQVYTAHLPTPTASTEYIYYSTR